MKDTILTNIRSALGRAAESPLAARPAIYPARQPLSQDAEIERFLAEVRLLSGSAQALPPDAVPKALRSLVEAENVRKATLWNTPLLERLQIGQCLQQLGVELVPAGAGKRALAECDLGVTEADYALPETGTLALHSSVEKPRAVSLLPRVHLALLTPAALRPDLHQVFAEAKASNYLVFITGPSRTSDIELTLTLGVHGPKKLAVFMVQA